jgi:hypothetical protein
MPADSTANESLTRRAYGGAMPASSSRERLNRLLDLAARGEAGRTALLGELAALLLDWPSDYAQAMRGPFEALFEKTAREADPETRAALADRLTEHDALPVALLNEFFLDASPLARARILKRNEALDDELAGGTVDGAALVAAARATMNGAFVELFAAALALPAGLARTIFADRAALAIACRGAGLDRAAFSAIALITGAAAPEAYDEVPEAAARRLVAFWRERG